MAKHFYGKNSKKMSFLIGYLILKIKNRLSLIEKKMLSFGT